MSHKIAIRQTLRLIGPCALPILAAFAMFASPQDAFAGSGTNTSLPFYDDFEAYTNLTPLDTGTNGWYGSSSNIIVQINTVRTGTNAAIIPYDCTLSNRFKDIPVTNVWIQMDVRPSFYDSTNPPVVDTNQAGMFYINSNGNFVVHNGPATNLSPTNSQNWVTLANTPVVSNAWVRINIYDNFAQTNWALYADGALMTNNIGFVNTNLLNFAGFDVYNGATTSYMDNVSVTAIATNEAAQRPLVVIPPTPSGRSFFVGETPSVQTVKVCNVWENSIGFEITTNQPWISAAPTNGNVAPGTTNIVTLTYAPAAAWQRGVSNALVTVVATNGTDRWDTQTVSLVMNIMDLQVTPTNLTNAVWVGEKPTNQTFTVQNAGGGSFTYTTATGAYWIACSPTSGTVGANSPNTLTLSYSNTAGWVKGTASNTTVTITSSDSGGTSRTVNVTLNVLDVQAKMSVAPALLSNVVWVGATPSNRTFAVYNSGGCPLNFTAAKTSTCAWITSVLPVSGTVPANSSQLVTVAFAATTGWTPQTTSNASIDVISTNGGGVTQTVAVVQSVTNIASLLEVAPLSLINGVVVGATPSNQSFEVRNLGDVSFPYTVTVTTGGTWMSATAGTTLAARSTNVVTLTYQPTTDWPPGQSNGAVTVTTSDGTGATNTVGVTLYIYRSGITNTIPFYDNFEQYTNLTPLVDGINGWYGDSAGIVVQQDVKWAGLQAAMIPVDCTLSNPFMPAITTNVWVQMDVRPSLFDATNTPVVDTNATWMFYLNSNGNFVVHDGAPSPDPTNSINWVTLTNGGIGTNGTNWVTIGIYEDFTRKKWDLYTNGVLVTNNIKFVNPAPTNFMGFNVYNGAATTYLDYVSVTVSNRTAGYIGLSTTTLTYTATYGGASPADKTVIMTNLGESAFTYSNKVTYGSGASWLTVTPVAGELAGSATQNLTCAVTLGSLPVADYVATNTISSPNDDATNAPQTIVVTLTVGKQTPTVTSWGSATAITYGQALSNSVLSSVAATNAAGDPVLGTNTFNAPATTPNAGTADQAVTFTPNDAANYNTVLGVVSVTVNKQTPTVSVSPSATEITYPQALSDSILSLGTVTNAAGATVPGTFTFTSPGTIPNAGTANQAVTFTPDDDDNYNTAASTASVKVNQAAQTITFPAIAAQPEGNLTLALSATASSALTVSFTNTSELGTNINNTTHILTFNGVGVYTIKAFQTGSVNYAAAPDVSRTFPVYNSAAAPTTNTIPWRDNFETYYDLEPLINGTNGWYGSSADIIVQTNIVATGIYITATGTNAALIPEDCTLSNRFVAGTPLNVRLEMDSRPVRSDFSETNFPAVNTNAVALFYVDTNGHFVVCNGSTWCMVSNAVGSGEFVVTNDTWAHIVIYLDYRHRNWKLKANNVLITNRIGFTTQQTNGFRGFDVYSGNSSTSYLDNVSVNWWDRFKVNGVLDHLIRSVNGVIPDRILGVPPP